MPTSSGAHCEFGLARLLLLLPPEPTARTAAPSGEYSSCLPLGAFFSVEEGCRRLSLLPWLLALLLLLLLLLPSLLYCA